ncbi:Sulfurtransferase TusD [Trichinella pseudospiralis]
MTILYDVVGKQQLMSKEEDREAVVREEEDINSLLIFLEGRKNGNLNLHFLTMPVESILQPVAVADLLKCNPRSDGDRSFLDILNDSSEENDIVDIVQAI